MPASPLSASPHLRVPASLFLCYNAQASEIEQGKVTIMRLKKLFGFLALLAMSVFSSACITFEQEVFLNPDGSGEFVLYISMPDLPEQATAGAPVGKDPVQTLDQFKKEVLSGLPPTLKVKEVKEIRKNGVHGIMAVFQFKDLNDVNAAISNLGKDALKDGDLKGESEWSIKLTKNGALNNFTSRILFDATAKSNVTSSTEVKTEGNKPGQTSGEAKAEIKMEGMEQIEALMLGMIRMRFVLHTPAPIKESNADMVFQERTAIWNSSLAAFNGKTKKPIEMKATF